MATLTLALSPTCDPTNYAALHNAISSLASADGSWRYALQAGQTRALSGRALARASLSAVQAPEPEPQTRATYGPCSSNSLRPAGLALLWESKLRHRLAAIGSPECATIWKASPMRSGPPLCRLALSAPRIGENAFGLWATPTAMDCRRGTRPPRPWDSGKPLTQQVGETVAALWPTPSARDWKDSPGMSPERPDGRPRTDHVPRVAFGLMPNVSNAPTGKYGALNPGLPSWLMGYPEAWQAASPDTVMQSSRKSPPK